MKIYLKRGKIKVEFVVVKGKKLYDKCEVIVKRDVEFEIKKKMKEYLRWGGVFWNLMGVVGF